MSLYQKMQDVVSKVAGQPSAGDNTYLSAHAVDFEFHDKDLVENHFGGGNKLLWIIKGSGCGTDLADARTMLASTLLDRQNVREGDLYFAIDVTDTNQGEVKSLTLEAAREYTESLRDTPSPEPLRSPLFSGIAEKLGHDQSQSGYSHLFNMANDLMSTPGEQIFLRIEPLQDLAGKHARVTFAKPKLLKDPARISRTKKQTGVYVLGTGKDFEHGPEAKPLYFRIKPHVNDAYADIEPCSEQVFRKALTAAQKPKEMSPTPSL